MQRVYGEFILKGTTSENVVPKIREFEVELGLNQVPEKFIIRKLGIKVDTRCEILVNGRSFLVDEKEPLEFGYDSIKVDNLVFKTSNVNAVIRYMYYREDKVYQ